MKIARHRFLNRRPLSVVTKDAITRYQLPGLHPAAISDPQRVLVRKTHFPAACDDPPELPDSVKCCLDPLGTARSIHFSASTRSPTRNSSIRFEPPGTSTGVPAAKHLPVTLHVTPPIVYRGDTRAVEIDPTDVLFIDTRHDYDQLAAELARHAEEVRRAIALHDTTAFGDRGETPGARGALAGRRGVRRPWGVRDPPPGREQQRADHPRSVPGGRLHRPGDAGVATTRLHSFGEGRRAAGQRRP